MIAALNTMSALAIETTEAPLAFLVGVLDVGEVEGVLEATGVGAN